MIQNYRTHLTVVVETCTDCHLHSWCSRHDETKYWEYYEKLKEKIETNIPNTII
jgi:hypothetical protein